MGISMYAPVHYRKTPYNMVYGTDAMLPVEVREPTMRRQLEHMSLNNESLATNLDVISELRDKA